jgi:hypothetical protein
MSASPRTHEEVFILRISVKGLRQHSYIERKLQGLVAAFSKVTFLSVYRRGFYYERKQQGIKGR